MNDWNKQTVVQLKAELKRRGLGQAGLKQELVTRLDEDDAAITVDEKEAPLDSEPAESTELQPAESSVDPASVDVTSKDVTVTSPTPVAEDVVQLSSSSDGDVQTAAPAESDKQDVPITAPETPAAADITPPAPAEIAQDAQKRKRRSESPPQSAEADSHNKRFKADQSSEAQTSAPSGVTGIISKIKDGLMQNTSIAEDIAQDAKDVERSIELPGGEAMGEDHATAAESVSEDVEMSMNEQDTDVNAREGSLAETAAPEDTRNDAHGSGDHFGQEEQKRDMPKRAQQPTTHEDDADAMRLDNDVQPAIHPATRALYIKNFMRPLRENVVREHLLQLATPHGDTPDNDDLDEFFLDQIRTHAFAIFKTTTLASRVRNALHDVIWPDERERKALWVDFVPPEKVREWIDEEKAQGRGRSARWEVAYDRQDDGVVVARLDSGTAPPPALSAAEPSVARPIPSGPAVKNVNDIPLGPRGGRGTEGAPLGPRDAPRGPSGRPPRQNLGFPGGPVQTTQQDPPVSYQLVSDDLAARRLRNMRSFYTRDLKRDLGPETDINRYTFEQGDNFVDRGQEVFVGIRPPHREAQRRRQSGGGRPPPRGPPPRGPPPSRGGRRGGNRRAPRPLSDRYLPGINDSGPYRPGDRGNFGSRLDEDRRDRFDDRDRRY